MQYDRFISATGLSPARQTRLILAHTQFQLQTIFSKSFSGNDVERKQYDLVVKESAKNVLSQLLTNLNYKTGLKGVDNQLTISDNFKEKMANLKNSLNQSVIAIKEKQGNQLKNVSQIIAAWQKNDRHFFAPTGIKDIKKILKSKLDNGQKLLAINKSLEKISERSSENRSLKTQIVYGHIKEALLKDTQALNTKDTDQNLKKDARALERLRSELNKLPNNFCIEVDNIKNIALNKNSSFKDIKAAIKLINAQKNWQLSNDVEIYQVFKNKEESYETTQALKSGMTKFITSLTDEDPENARTPLKDLIQAESQFKKYSGSSDQTYSLKEILENSKKIEIIAGEHNPSFPKHN